ncbi:hypothetical protein [Saccharopolyspora griseoalba]|uniref:Secreted protein n=1 Tax=Saccharopolyspora griseoalba TaxID=1431848 RepID=A0ABW2LJI5_9PSEU
MRAAVLVGGILTAALSPFACGGQATPGATGSADSGDVVNVAQQVATDVPSAPAPKPGDRVFDPYQDPTSGGWWEVYAPTGPDGGYLGEMDAINAVGEYLELPDSAKRGPNHRAEVLGRFTCADVRQEGTDRVGFRCAPHNSDLVVIALPQAG